MRCILPARFFPLLFLTTNASCFEWLFRICFPPSSLLSSFVIVFSSPSNSNIEFNYLIHSRDHIALDPSSGLERGFSLQTTPSPSATILSIYHNNSNSILPASGCCSYCCAFLRVLHSAALIYLENLTHYFISFSLDLEFAVSVCFASRNRRRIAL